MTPQLEVARKIQREYRLRCWHPDQNKLDEMMMNATKWGIVVNVLQMSIDKLSLGVPAQSWDPKEIAKSRLQRAGNLLIKIGDDDVADRLSQIAAAL